MEISNSTKSVQPVRLRILLEAGTKQVNVIRTENYEDEKLPLLCVISSAAPVDNYHGRCPLSLEHNRILDPALTGQRSLSLN